MNKLPLLVSLALTSAAFAQDLGLRGTPQTHPIAIVNAAIHPVSGKFISSGFLIFDKGAITQIGEGAMPPPADHATEIIDAKGKHVYPGLISACTTLGLNEMATDRGPNDLAELGDIKPEVFPAVAVNPDSTLIPVVRTNGVLTFACFASGGTIPGHVSALRTDGWTSDEMTIERDLGLIINWPGVRPIHAEWMDRSDDDQRKEIRQRLEAIDSWFTQSQAYASRRAADPVFPRDVRFDGMTSVLAPAADHTGIPRPLFINAQDADQITSAVTWSISRGLRPIIVGGRDAPLCSELLKKHDVGVIVLGTHTFPKRDDSPYNAPFSLPARLQSAGIRWCLASGQDAAHERTLPNIAATAVAHGLDHDRAVEAITLSAAQILGISDRVGSLEPGKSATLFISDGDVLEIASNPTMAWIDGRAVDLTNKQSRLYEKYRKKYTPTK